MLNAQRFTLALFLGLARRIRAAFRRRLVRRTPLALLGLSMAVASGGCSKAGEKAYSAPPMAAAGGPGADRRARSIDQSASAPSAAMEESAAPPPESKAMGTAAGGRAGARRSRRDDRQARRQPGSATAMTPQPTPTPSPGLGTAYGEQHHSSVIDTAFARGAGSPDVVLSLWYNDNAGIDAMAAAYGRRATTRSSSSTSDGAFVVELIDEHGRTLPATDIDGRRYAAGQAGARYKLRVFNNSAHRFEVVASVDGLDVIDGADAAFHKRGYVLDAWTSITIDGWRTSDDSVAAFRFSGLEDSYAERTGRGRNVGVVGVAFFHERGSATWEELGRRHSSDPFPGQYAPPPPPRWR